MTDSSNKAPVSSSGAGTAKIIKADGLKAITVLRKGDYGMKLANETMKVIGRLSPEKKEKVEAVVRRHITACLKNGFPPENIDRVYLEAIEIVNLEELFPEPKAEESRDWEPARRYDQYVSPKAA